MESIPSESECYPAKLAHGHVQWLIDHGVRTIFHPCVFYEHQETPGAQNHFNCPIVVSYPENLKNNVDAIGEDGVTYLRPFLAFTDEKTAAKRLADFCKETWGISASETRAAVHAAWLEQQHAKADIRAQGAAALAWIEQNHGRGIVLAGRPYHVDPEINHGIPELIASYDLAVLTEDSLPIDFTPARPLRANDQWSITPASIRRQSSSEPARSSSSSSSTPSAAGSTPSRPTRSRRFWRRATVSTPF